jgi:hypothetical protein
VNRVHPPGLADPIDSAGSLLQPERRPRQLEVYDEAASMVKIETLAGGVGREQQPHRTGGELSQGVRSLSRRQATVKTHERDARQRRRDVLERVAVFRKHDCRFSGSGNEPPQRSQLALGASRVVGQGQDAGEMSAFLAGIAQSTGRQV